MNSPKLSTHCGGYLAEFAAALEKPWPDNATATIVCHGHSVPAGYFRTPAVCSFDSYPHLLHRRLKEEFPYAIINVIVTARGGESSDQGAARFEADVLSHRPDVVTIDYSLNDRRIGLSCAKDAWSQMIDLSFSAGVKVVLLTPTPDLKSIQPQGGDELLSRHADQVRQLAMRSKTGLADSYKAFHEYVSKGGSLSDLMAQHNHPNRKGHELVAAKLFKCFQSA